MSWIRANSTTIERFRYDLKNQILEIEFKKGTVYQYFDVPANIVEAFAAQVNSGASAGQYFNSKIRDCFRYVRVKGPRQ
jgi:hypothetical protein